MSFVPSQHYFKSTKGLLPQIYLLHTARTWHWSFLALTEKSLQHQLSKTSQVKYQKLTVIPQNYYYFCIYTARWHILIRIKPLLKDTQPDQKLVLKWELCGFYAARRIQVLSLHWVEFFLVLSVFAWVSSGFLSHSKDICQSGVVETLNCPKIWMWASSDLSWAFRCHPYNDGVGREKARIKWRP